MVTKHRLSTARKMRPHPQYERSQPSLGQSHLPEAGPASQSKDQALRPFRQERKFHYIKSAETGLARMIAAAPACDASPPVASARKGRVMSLLVTLCAAESEIADRDMDSMQQCNHVLGLL